MVAAITSNYYEKKHIVIDAVKKFIMIRASKLFYQLTI